MLAGSDIEGSALGITDFTTQQRPRTETQLPLSGMAAAVSIGGDIYLVLLRGPVRLQRAAALE